jgi:chromosome partitioning protein
LGVSWVECSTCAKRFVPRFSYQTGPGAYYCSIPCRSPSLERASSPPETSKEGQCSACGARFAVEFAYQVIGGEAGESLVCSRSCRDAVAGRASRPPRATPPPVLAVLNQKGGTGKTTTAVSVAAGLAAQGRRVLLVDLDAQGNVAVSLGLQPNQALYDVLVGGADPRSVWVRARHGLTVLPSNQTVAAAEIELVNTKDRATVLRRRMAPVLDDFDLVLLDCGPSLSLMNQNALTFSSHVLIPVSCDYLALVGVRQVLRTVQHVKDVLLHDLEVIGVLPTLHDGRNRISGQSIDALRGYFGEKVMPPIRVNSKLKEAPSHKQTIFEYAPDSNGALDYGAVLTWLQDRLPHATREPEVQNAS